MRTTVPTTEKGNTRVAVTNIATRLLSSAHEKATTATARETRDKKMQKTETRSMPTTNWDSVFGSCIGEASEFQQLIASSFALALSHGLRLRSSPVLLNVVVMGDLLLTNSMSDGVHRD